MKPKADHFLQHILSLPPGAPERMRKALTFLRQVRMKAASHDETAIPCWIVEDIARAGLDSAILPPPQFPNEHKELWDEYTP